MALTEREDERKSPTLLPWLGWLIDCHLPPASNQLTACLTKGVVAFSIDDSCCSGLQESRADVRLQVQECMDVKDKDHDFEYKFGGDDGDDGVGVDGELVRACMVNRTWTLG